MPSKKRTTKTGIKTQIDKNTVQVEILIDGGKTRKTFTVALDDIDPRLCKVCGSRSPYVGKIGRYRKAVLYQRELNKRSHTRSRYATVYGKGPGGKGDGGNPPIISTDIEE